MKPCLFSAPNEEYTTHINLCLEKFEIIYTSFKFTCRKVFGIGEEEDIKNALKKMILFHDLGKLTERWQRYVGTRNQLPAHAPLGAVYLWKILPSGLKEPISFAVAIHHSDSGLLSDNIERPDVQAILDGVVNLRGEIIWSEGVKELHEDYFPRDVRELTVYDLRDMARGLRLWAKGESLLEQHRRRLQVTLAHHILKLCDISSASERSEFREDNNKVYYGGMLMVNEIVKYVNNISQRSQ